MEAPKLRIWFTIWWSYRHAFQNLRHVLGLGWLAFVLLSLVFTSVPTVVYLFDTGYPSAVGQITGLMIISYFAVRWHRFILLNERKQPILRFGREYLLYVVCLASVMVVDYVTTWGVSWLMESSHIVVELTFNLVALFFYFVWFACVYMVLPAVAVCDRAMTIEKAWELWRGNRLRFLFLIIISALLFAGTLIVFLQLELVLGRAISDYLVGAHVGEHLAMAITYFPLSLLLVYVILFITAATAGTLTLSYANIVRRGLQVDRDYTPPDAIRQRVESQFGF